MTNTIRKEIKPINNEFGEIPVPRTVGFVEIDATKKPRDYAQTLDALSERFDNQFMPMAIAADQRRIVAKTAREAAQLKQQEKDAAQRKAEDTPLTRFIRAVKLKNTSYAQLNEWTTKHTNTEKKATLAEFETLAQRRGLALSIEQIDFATNFLRSTITAAAEPQPQPVNLLSRIKEKLGV